MFHGSPTFTITRGSRRLVQNQSSGLRWSGTGAKSCLHDVRCGRAARRRPANRQLKFWFLTPKSFSPNGITEGTQEQLVHEYRVGAKCSSTARGPTLTSECVRVFATFTSTSTSGG